jgi:small subunit ribosomal protein S10
MFTHFASHAASSLAIPVSRTIFLPTQRSLWTVPKGPFVHKKNQENFERRVHKRAIKAWDADPDVVERWIKYLESHTLGGVGMRIIRWERATVGVGEERLKNVMDQMRLASVTNSDKVKALGEKIVEQEMAVAAENLQITQKPFAEVAPSESV